MFGIIDIVSEMGIQTLLLVKLPQVDIKFECHALHWRRVSMLETTFFAMFMELICWSSKFIRMPFSACTTKHSLAALTDAMKIAKTLPVQI